MFKSFTVITILAVACSFVGSAFAEDRIPMIEGEKETFGMVNLVDGQCTLSVQDSEMGVSPKIELSPVTVRNGGNFIGGKYLSSWTHEGNDENVNSTFATIQIFRGDAGRQIVSIGLEMSYNARKIVKNNQFVLFLAPNSNLTDFKERLSGPGIYDKELHSVDQGIQNTNGRVSFTRITRTGITISVGCNLK